MLNGQEEGGITGARGLRGRSRTSDARECFGSPMANIGDDSEVAIVSRSRTPLHDGEVCDPGIGGNSFFVEMPGLGVAAPGSGLKVVLGLASRFIGPRPIAIGRDIGVVLCGAAILRHIHAVENAEWDPPTTHTCIGFNVR